MRIVSWNIRAGGGKRITGIYQQLLQWQADIIALSEFRGTPPSQGLTAQLAEAGFSYQLSTIDPDKAASNALLLASRYPLTQLHHPQAPQTMQRWLLAKVESPQAFTLGLMHVPNYVSRKKQPFLDAVSAIAQAWPGGPGLLIGDTNSGLPDLDEESKVFGKVEAAWFETLAAKWVGRYFSDAAWPQAGLYLVFTQWEKRLSAGSSVCQPRP